MAAASGRGNGGSLQGWQEAAVSTAKVRTSRHQRDGRRNSRLGVAGFSDQPKPGRRDQMI
ncbi:unnamed protein product [Spirodela intermedia]|uniref:Uncharacterized protein n=1 Tax=Spirodela intermedia TaxID=51605 RepID=A0A7I8L6L0_SPIIN|nr:unnamed protein product [Spirodela intermedia]